MSYWTLGLKRGRADVSPLAGTDRVIVLATCPDCNGRGYFLINPFAIGGPNGAGGAGNMTQCRTCESACEFYEKWEELPPGFEYPAMFQKEPV